MKSPPLPLGSYIYMSLPVRGAWIEIGCQSLRFVNATSLPVRGAWIEIGRSVTDANSASVAPRKGSVD